MIKGVTFDLDNTLEDFVGFKREGIRAASKAMIKAGLDMPYNKLYKELYAFYFKDVEGDDVFKKFLWKKGVRSDKILAAAINAYLLAKYKHLKPFPDVRRTLSALKRKGLRLGVITDAPRLKAYQRLDMIGLTDYFDFVVAYEDTFCYKPSPKPFLKALKILKLKPEEVMHVGDSKERDIKGAKGVGIKGNNKYQTTIKHLNRTKYY